MRVRMRNPGGASAGGNTSGLDSVCASSLRSSGRTALDDLRGPVDGEVGAELTPHVSYRRDREGHAGVVADVAQLLVVGKVCADQLVPVRRRLQCDPDQGNLGAAVGIEGDQSGIGTLSNELTRGVV